MTKVLRQKPGMASLYLKAIQKKNNKKHQIEDQLPALSLSLQDQTINAKHLRSYRAVCGFSGDGLVPSTYLQILTFPLQMALLTDPAMPYAVMGLVHINNRIEVLEPLDIAKETLSFEVSIGEQEINANGVLFEVVAEVKAQGRVVWRAIAGLLHRCKTSVGKKPTLVRDPMASNQRQWTLPANIGRRYGSISGDLNPIHLFAVSARLFGFKKQIAHGLYINAKACAQMEGQLPPAPYEIATEFKRPVFLPAKPVMFYQKAHQDIQLELWSRDNKELHMAIQIQPLKKEG